MSEPSALLFKEATEFNIFDGITVPMRSNNNLFSILSAVAEGNKIEREETIRRHAGRVMILASLLHERAMELLDAFAGSQNLVKQLSSRELDVLKWSSSGKTSADIADILSISVSTVNKHMEHILKKFQTSTRTHAAVRAVTMGLIDPI